MCAAASALESSSASDDSHSDPLEPLAEKLWRIVFRRERRSPGDTCSEPGSSPTTEAGTDSSERTESSEGRGGSSSGTELCDVRTGTYSSLSSSSSSTASPAAAFVNSLASSASGASFATATCRSPTSVTPTSRRGVMIGVSPGSSFSDTRTPVSAEGTASAEGTVSAEPESAVSGIGEAGAAAAAIVAGASSTLTERFDSTISEAGDCGGPMASGCTVTALVVSSASCATSCVATVVRASTTSLACSTLLPGGLRTGDCELGSSSIRLSSTWRASSTPAAGAPLDGAPGTLRRCAAVDDPGTSGA